MSLTPSNYDSFLQNIIKKTTELSLKAARYAKQTNKQKKITEQEKQELNLAKKRLTKPISTNDFSILSKELKKIEQQNLDIINSMVKQKRETDRASVLSSLTSSYYDAILRQVPQRYMAGRNRFGKPIYKYRYNIQSMGHELKESSRSPLEAYFIAHSRIKDNRSYLNFGQGRPWVSHGRPESSSYQELTEFRIRDYKIDKDRAIELMSDPRSLKNYGIDKKYTAEQRDYLIQILKNEEMGKYLYTYDMRDNKEYLYIGKLHEAISMLLDPNAPNKIKATGLQVIGYGIKNEGESLFGKVTQVNRAKLAQNRFIEQVFKETPQFLNITQIAKNEKNLLDTFLTKSKTKNLSGIDLSEYNKFIAEATKQYNLYKSSIKSYTDTLQNIETKTNTGIYNYAYGYQDHGSGHRYGYGVEERLRAGNFNYYYKGFIDRAKNHAVLLEKAYTSAYNSLNKSLNQQLLTNASLEQQKTSVITSIDKLLKPEVTKKSTTNQADFIKQRMNRVSIYNPSSQASKRPI